LNGILFPVASRDRHGWLNHELRICRNSERRGLPWAAGLFERFGDGEKKFFFERAGDELNADGQAF
jgi:hypothetical protein